MSYYLEKMTKAKLTEILATIYDVADVENGYNYWFNKLLLRCLSIFKYDGLPDSLPQREIELNLILTNHAVIFEKDDELITNPTAIFRNENNVYYNPTMAIYANPKLNSEVLSIGETCEIIYNNPLQDNIFYLPCDGSMLTFIQRYARQLADIESTINIYTVNARLTSFPTASNDTVKSSIERLFTKLALGKRAVISDNAIVEQFRNVDINRSNIRDGLNDLLIARDKTLEMFYRDIGIKFYNPKKAQVTEDEVESNNSLLLISIKDMLEERKKGIERVNTHYGTNISVDIEDEFKPHIDGLKTNLSKGGANDAV